MEGFSIESRRIDDIEDLVAMWNRAAEVKHMTECFKRKRR